MKITFGRRSAGLLLALGLSLAGAGQVALTTSAAAAAPDVDDIASVSTTLGGHPVLAHFNDPATDVNGRGPEDKTIVTELVRLIGSAPVGSTIQGAVHSITGGTVGKSLLDAQARGVTVKVVFDGKVGDSDYSSADKKSIEQLKYFKYCGDKGAAKHESCISSATESNMHAKFFTFSATTDPKGAAHSDVSWFSSSNLTGESGTEQFNNSVTIYGDAKLRAGLDAFFVDLYAQKHVSGNDYLNGSQGYRVGDSGTMFASPEASTDMVADQLNQITPDSNCRVRLGESMALNRPKLVSAIKRLRSGGCKVWMVVGSQDDPNRNKINMTESSYNDLKSAGVDIRRRVDEHDKFIVVYAKYGSAYASRVYAGSQNWSNPGLTDNDELFVALAPETGSTHPLYDAYYAHFNDAYNRGTSCDSRSFPCS